MVSEEPYIFLTCDRTTDIRLLLTYYSLQSINEMSATEFGETVSGNSVIRGGRIVRSTARKLCLGRLVPHQYKENSESR